VKRLPVATFVCAAAAFALLMPVSASTQEIEPGAYWPIPNGLNIITVIDNFNWGDVAFDPSGTSLHAHPI
jgi:hypothetical protein